MCICSSVEKVFNLQSDDDDTNENFLVYSGKWPQAVRANGHLLLNSEKVCQTLMLWNMNLNMYCYYNTTRIFKHYGYNPEEKRFHLQILKINK